MTSISIGALKPDQSEKVYSLLCDLLRVKEEAFAGNLTFLNFSLDEDSTNLGAAADKTRVAQVTSSVLAQTIVAPNLFFQTDEGEFTVIFLDKNEAAATEICKECRDLIVQALIAMDDDQFPNIAVDVVEISYDDLVANPAKLLPSLSPESIKAVTRRNERRRPPPKLSVKLGFRPVWNSAKNVISTYMVSLRRELPSGETFFGYSTLPNRNDPSEIGSFDRAMVNLSVRALVEGIAQGRNFVLVSPINYASFVDPKQGPVYHAILRQTPPAIRKRLCLQLIGAYPDAPIWKLRSTIDALAGYCRSVVLQLPLDPNACRSIGEARIGAIGTSAYRDPRHAEQDIEAMLSEFAKAAARYKVPLYLTSVDDGSLAYDAQQIGFEFLAGGFVGDYAESPGDIRFCQYEELKTARGDRAA